MRAARMKPLAFLALAAGLLSGTARAQPLVRDPGEPAARFAGRVLGLERNAAELHAIESAWNGRATIIADFPNGEAREVVALQQEPDGRYRRLHVTAGEEEGGRALVAAIGFANADRDARRELIVILAWQVRHYDVAGTFYQVRILDDPAPGRDALARLPAAERLFAAGGCDCDRRNGTRERYRFKTIASVRRALRRAGY